jgi:GxxExxY protein
MKELDRGINALSEQVIGAAIEVHRELGPGLLESIYEQALCLELKLQGIPFDRQAFLPVHYKGELLDGTLRLDMIIAGVIIVELKAVEALLPVHEAQLLSYLSRRVETNWTVKPYTGIRGRSKINQTTQFILTQPLKLANKPLGLLLNFHAPTLIQGLKRLINSRHLP